MGNHTKKNTKKSPTNFKLSPLNPCVAGIDIVRPVWANLILQPFSVH
jgi:hypothetical protein